MANKEKTALSLASKALELAYKANAAGSPFDIGRSGGYFYCVAQAAHASLKAVYGDAGARAILDDVWNSDEYDVAALRRFAHDRGLTPRSEKKNPGRTNPKTNGVSMRSIMSKALK